jgi:hypothetical protein
VLQRLLDGDPLDLVPCTDRLVRERSVLIAPERVYHRAAARIAHAAMRYRGEPPLAEWIEGLFSIAIQELVAEDLDAERAGIPPATPWDPDYAMITEITGCQPAVARSVANAFNHLPHNVRRTTFAVLVEGKSLNRWVAEGHGPPERAREELLRGWKTLAAGIDPERDGHGGPTPEWPR